MNQNFSNKELLKFIKKTEIKDLDKSESELLDDLDIAYQEIIDGSFEFDLVNKNGYVITDNITHKAILRKLNYIIKKIYKDEQANRRMIISQIKVLLSENVPMYIFKTDVENFYGSINPSLIISRFKDDAILSYYSIFLLNKLFNNPVISVNKGLPMGIGVSATLSEFYMRKFDKWIRRKENIYYYARFVDDIVIFSNKQNVIKEIAKNIDKEFKKYELKRNETKTKIFDGNKLKEDNPLEYLGYKFTTYKIKNENRYFKKVSVSIADNKVKKIKTRIIKALLDFRKSNDFQLLKNRIKFLTGNYSVKKNSNGNDLKAGIYYNYSEITNFNIFKELDVFLRKAIYSNKFGNTLSQIQKNEISRYSFLFGFQNKVYHPIKSTEMKRIKACWE